MLTTEQDFHDALDREPDAHHVRLIFADWLDEHDDPRAEGCRALGWLRRRPVIHYSQPFTNDTDRTPRVTIAFGTTTNRNWRPDEPNSGFMRDNGCCILDAEWFTLVEQTKLLHVHDTWKYFHTRREAEDAAAKAFSRLPADRRAELLSAPVPA